MKINEGTRYSHPVLWTQTNDYSGGIFDARVEATENAGGTSIVFKYEVIVTEPSISNAIVEGQLQLGLLLMCVETYFHELVPLPAPIGVHQVDSGALQGEVLVRAVAWAKKPIRGFEAKAVHAEFGRGPFQFDEADITALGELLSIEIGNAKLASWASIFEMGISEFVPNEQFIVDLESNKIRILANQPTYEKLVLFRNTPRGRALLFNGVYLPTVMHALHILKEDPTPYDSFRWQQVIAARLRLADLSIESCQPLQVAQQFLGSPLKHLFKHFGGED